LVPAFDDVDDLLNKEDNNDDEDYKECVGMDEISTPTSRPIVDVLGFLASSMLSSTTRMPMTLMPSGQSERKRKSEDMASVVQQLADL